MSTRQQILEALEIIAVGPNHLVIYDDAVRILNARGVTTISGKRFTRHSVHYYLADPDIRRQRSRHAARLRTERLRAARSEADNLRALCGSCNSWREGSDSIRRLRHWLGEDVWTFGARFGRSGRTVEDWEQRRRRPDYFVRMALKRLYDANIAGR